VTYTQFTQAQRYQIYALLKTEHSQAEIADVIGVNKSTISRELRRNRGQRVLSTQTSTSLCPTTTQKSAHQTHLCRDTGA
jgi:IS30 family transposase